MRKIHRGLSAAILAGLSAFAAGAAAQEATPFPSRLAQAITPLEINPDGFSGAGARILSEAVTASRYVLIGESHMTREIPAFTTQICRLMAPSGLTAMVVETGPEVARIVDAAMRSEDREARIDQFLRAQISAPASGHRRDLIGPPREIQT